MFSGHCSLDELASAIDQLARVRMPTSAIDPLVLTPQVRDYARVMLNELLATGEVTCRLAGRSHTDTPRYRGNTLLGSRNVRHKT